MFWILTDPNNYQSMLKGYKRRGAAVRFAARFAQKHNRTIYVVHKDEGTLTISFTEVKQ